MKTFFLKLWVLWASNFYIESVVSTISPGHSITYVWFRKINLRLEAIHFNSWFVAIDSHHSFPEQECDQLGEGPGASAKKFNPEAGDCLWQLPTTKGSRQRLQVRWWWWWWQILFMTLINGRVLFSQWAGSKQRKWGRSWKLDGYASQHGAVLHHHHHHHHWHHHHHHHQVRRSITTMYSAYNPHWESLRKKSRLRFQILNSKC